MAWLRMRSARAGYRCRRSRYGRKAEYSSGSTDLIIVIYSGLITSYCMDPAGERKRGGIFDPAALAPAPR